MAVRYYQSGRLVTEYFDETNRSLDKTLQATFPGRTVAVLDRSRDSRQLILWVDAPDCQGSLLGTSVAGGSVHSSSAGNWVELRSDAAYAPAGAQSAQVVVRLVKVEAAGTLELRLDGIYLYATPGHAFRDGFDLASTCRWTSEQLF